MTDRSYRSSHSALGVTQFVGDGRARLHAIQAKLNLDFGLYDDRGGGTTIAQMSWLADGSCLIEGADNTLAALGICRESEFADRARFEQQVFTRWREATSEQERHHRAEREYRDVFPEPMPLGRKGTKVPGDGPGEVVHLTTADHIYGWIGESRFTLTYGTVNDDMPEIARMTRLKNGGLGFSSKYGASVTLDATIDRATAAERWFAYSTKAGQDADFRRTRERAAWREGLALAGL